MDCEKIVELEDTCTLERKVSQAFYHHGLFVKSLTIEGCPEFSLLSTVSLPDNKGILCLGRSRGGVLDFSENPYSVPGGCVESDYWDILRDMASKGCYDQDFDSVKEFTFNLSRIETPILQFDSEPEVIPKVTVKYHNIFQEGFSRENATWKYHG